jgi:hypothetical protein
MLRAVVDTMRELGVDKFNFEMPYTDEEIETRRLYATIELGGMPVPDDAIAEERVARIRDHNEQEAMAREERRRFAASTRIGPRPEPRPDRRR